jgi:hypothetical protein
LFEHPATIGCAPNPKSLQALKAMSEPAASLAGRPVPACEKFGLAQMPHQEFRLLEPKNRMSLVRHGARIRDKPAFLGEPNGLHFTALIHRQ